MRQRWFALTLLIAILGLVAACNSDDDDSAGGEADTTPTEELSTVAPEEGTEPSGATDGTAENDEESGAPTAANEGTSTSEGVQGTATDEAGGTVTGTADATQTTGEDSTPTESDAEPTVADLTPTASDEADGGTATETDGTAVETATESEEGAMARLGEPVEVSGVEVTVDEVVDLTLTGPMDGEILEPDEGNRFIGIRLTIENIEAEPVGLVQVLGRVHLDDGEGERYEIDLGATALGILSGDIESLSSLDSGDEVQIVIGFQVPDVSEVSELTLVMESQDTMAETVRVQLEES